jgi:hypothetical protein
MCTSFTIAPVHTKNSPAVLSMHSRTITTGTFLTKKAAAVIYDAIKLNEFGLTQEAFNNAWKGYEKLLTQKTISKSNYLTICDFSQSSAQKRFYLIDILNEKLLVNTYVAHGKNSGTTYATRFSNINDSHQSSLGFYTTAQTYIGEHGLSLRLNGVDGGFNNNAYARSIVIHGATYVDATRVKAGVMMGRSFGCPALPQNESEKIINIIKNGTCLFIYHPDRNYLQHSKILNG